jgi:hypothetical protein
MRRTRGREAAARSNKAVLGSGDCPTRSFGRHIHRFFEAVGRRDSTRSRHPSARMATAR